MKRFVILIAAFMLVGMALAAEEAVLIDFDQLIADYPADNPKDNQSTMMDFGITAGSSFSDEEKRLMKTSLAIGNWEVRLASSSRTIVNQEYTLVRPAKVKDDAPENNFPGKNVMGVRVHFPMEFYNGWALIKPPFEIPAYMDKTTLDGNGNLTVVAPEDQRKGGMFDGVGVLKNVGVLKTVYMWVHGLNFPHKVSLLLQHANTDIQEVVLGHVQFDGWRRLQWDNPNYISEVRNRDLRLEPLYPKTAPVLKLIGIRVYRDAMHEGDDFVGYFKDISVVYDKALIKLERDIDDEMVWGILQKREEARRNAEMRRLGNIQVLRFIEQEKMHQENRQEGGQQQQPPPQQ
ncbi:MAG: flagellar filament outer layer protein FlaA [Spirochaetales bacterium]|jgi:hypothetical protein|nr:flagellar filament outer layer protein FlaA [Spirochaetales bacterium]